MKKKKKLFIKAVIVIAAWAALGLLTTLIFGRGEKEPFTVEMFSPAVSIGSLSVSTCTLTGFAITAALTLLAIVFRVFCVPRFAQIPKGIQNVVELAVSKLDEYTCAQVGTEVGGELSGYILALCTFLVSCAAMELFGVRSPSSDILVTAALALVTFFLINFYGLKQRGLRGRAKQFITPSPVMAPFKLITDIALPVSMACRLFGNMIAGFIIMELVYYSLGNFAAGPPAVLGLYFNIFHPLIQAFIFMTLTLSFISEAIEKQE